MRIAYFDCFSGAAGDMIIAALLDAGCPLEHLQSIVAELRLPGVSLSAERVRRGGVAATHARVLLGPESVGGAQHAAQATLGQHSHAHGPSHAHAHSHAPASAETHDHVHAHSHAGGHGHAEHEHRHGPHRTLSDVIRIIEGAEIPPSAARKAKDVFTRLAEAEAYVHGTTPEQVHFHEVGAEDAIVDIVCACAGLEQLGIERVLCSPVPTGHGVVHCDHGQMPVPAPATANLLRGVPLARCDEPGELTTPTGAAILTTLAADFTAPPAGRLVSIGYGAGTREGQTRPNVLRLLILETDEEHERAERRHAEEEQDTVVQLEAQIDDATGQMIAYACERLLAAGALDAWVVPIIMKKGRPGQLVCALATPEWATAVEDVLFRETSTFGVRRHECARSKLSRELLTVSTPFGPIRVKLGRRSHGGAGVPHAGPGSGEIRRAWPEYHDCAAAAERFGVSLRDVQEAALKAWQEC